LRGFFLLWLTRALKLFLCKSPAAHDRRLIIGNNHSMSQFPDPPDPQYAPAYPATPSSLDNTQQQHQQQPHQQQLHYSPQNIFPKIDNLEILQQQAQHASHALNNPRNHAPPHTTDQSPKPNRLRKACDSCSIRKVKVSGVVL